MLKVFSSDTCGYCRKLKNYLDSKQITYDVIDVSESSDNYKQLVDVSGQSGIPVSLFDNGEVIVGFDVEKIEQQLGLTS